MLLIIIFCIFNLTSAETGGSQTRNVPSLFQKDTCAPPCWFGIEAGISTSQDAYEIMLQNSHLFENGFVTIARKNDVSIQILTLDLDSLLKERSLYFYWRVGQPSGNTTIGSSIFIEEGIVSHMQLNPDRRISLKETLYRMGQPDTIRAGSSLGYGYVLLYYRQPRLIIELSDYWVFEPCVMADFFGTFEIEYIEYLSPTTYREQALESLKGSSYVSPETWNAWRADSLADSETECSAAFSALDD